MRGREEALVGGSRDVEATLSWDNNLPVEGAVPLAVDTKSREPSSSLSRF